MRRPEAARRPRSDGAWSGVPQRLRATVRTATFALVLGWGYAAVYAMRRSSVHAGLVERGLLGRRRLDAQEAELVASVLDWSLVLWIALPLVLWACTVVVAVVGVGHAVLIVVAVLSTPVLPMFAAFFSMDPLLAALALGQGAAAAAVLVRFVRALGAA